jgi:hypothetical protein
MTVFELVDLKPAWAKTLENARELKEALEGDSKEQDAPEQSRQKF